MRGWNLQRRTGSGEADLAQFVNLVVCGWMAYYGRFYHSALYPLLEQIDFKLLRWVKK